MSQTLSNGLWVVATPIGNLSDLTPRARNALENADQILCEDTRRTQVLLHALQIAPKRLSRLDAHTEPRKIQAWVEELQSGANFALVTDAGTPSMSDPGSALVAQAREAGVRVVPIPGVSAVTALLSVCGFHETPFSFLGFFPRKESEQVRLLDELSSFQSVRVFIWFESPLRILDSLSVVSQTYPSVKMVVGKEMTKIYERFFSGGASEVLEQVQKEISEEGKIGEWCFALRFEKVQESEPPSKGNESSLYATKALTCLLKAGVSATEASRQVSQEFGIQKRILYEKCLEIQEKKTSKRG